MTPTKIAAAFGAAFARLTKRHLRNFRYHLEQRTPICCGPAKGLVYADGEGGG